MAETRLEIVVNGRLQTALTTTPRQAGQAFPDKGFVMEEHHMIPFEMPDLWVPNYLVTLTLPSPRLPRPKRVFFDGGRECEFVVEPGSCAVVAPRELRKFRFEGEAWGLILQIEPEVLQSMIANPRDGNALELIRFWDGVDPVLRDLLLKIHAEVQSDFAAGGILAEHLCARLAEELIQRYSIGKLKIDQYKGGLPGTKLRQVMEYIDSHLDQNLTTGEIARVAGLSKYHFGKAFSASTRMTLHSFILARRMVRARALLAHSDLPLVHVAAEAGFSSQSHFTTVFLERTGVTPGRYRSERRPLSVAFGS